MRLYVAGSWGEQHRRARPMLSRARAAGIVIAHDWTVPFDTEVLPDALLPSEDRHRHAVDDLEGVLTCDVLWLLAPETQAGCGCWIEFGAALSAKWLRLGRLGWPLVVASGRTSERSIFTSLADRKFESDEDALTWIVAEHVAQRKVVHIMQRDGSQEENQGETVAGDVGQG